MKRTLIGLGILDTVVTYMGWYYVHKAYGVKGVVGFFLLIVISTTNEVMRKKFGEES